MAAMTKVSPLAPSGFPKLPQIGGVQFATAHAGVKYKERDDIMLAILSPGTEIAGVFTTSKTRAASVLDCQSKIGSNANGRGAAILVNSGNANAFTGKMGQASVDAITDGVAVKAGLEPSRVFTSSTGVIGEPLPHDRILNVLEKLIEDLSPEKIDDAARAIMTTDTFAKGASVTIECADGPIQIAGIAKGSGMIAPNMATMLVYIFTDAKIERCELQGIVSSLNETSFNAITVDSDTSTSDCLLVAATGTSGLAVDGTDDAFVKGLNQVMCDLAHQVVSDGEGASKFVEVCVTGALSKQEAKTHAMAIANSPLVKTAIAGEDPNWGRVVMAIGKSGAEADRDLLRICFGDIVIAENGWVSPQYSEQAGADYMKNSHISISVDLGLGNGTFTAWTCDLTHAYIEINADYRS